ncbi:MAG: energy-coupling factor transporter ATPase [Clostridiales bacterium]|nr:energy-coupling factor transporter ATPase [Clostridiales bacterium]
MQAVEFTNVSFGYGDGETSSSREVLKDFNLTIEKGEFIALLGRNGSGKSTCAKLINGLLTPSEGEVKVFGMSTKDKSNLFEIRKRAGMVFQNPDNQQIASIVEDDIAFGPENIGLPREQIKERIEYALKVTDTEKFRDAQVSRLSGGQKQRVAIAGAIAINPDILILDESTSMLDPKGRKEVMEVVRTLNKEKGMTVIDITHYMDEAVEADRVCVMGDGVIMATGTPKQIFANGEVLAKCGLELPVSAKIAQKLRENGLPIPDGILSKEELSKILCELLRKI